MQKKGGRPGPFYHMDDISVYLSRQCGGGGGGGSPIEKTSLRPYVVVSAPSTGVSNVRKVKNVLLLVNEEHMRKMCSFDGGPYCKQSKTGQWEGLGTRLCAVTV